VAGDLIVELRETGSAVAASAHTPHYDGYLEAGRDGNGEENSLTRKAVVGGVSLFVVAISINAINKLDGSG
jgi:hypothetical protein